MLDILYCEFYKLRKSYILLLVIVCASFLPMLLIFKSMLLGSNGSWMMLVDTIEIITFLLISWILFTIVTTYIFTREYTEKTASALFSYPVKREKIVLAKMMVIFALIVSFYFVQFILEFGCGIIFDAEMSKQNIIISNINIYFFTSLFQCMLIPLIVLIVSIVRSMVFPIIFSVIISVTDFFLLFIASYSKEIFYFPTMLTMLPYRYFNGETDISLLVGGCIGGIIFVISTFVCFVYFKKCDIV